MLRQLSSWLTVPCLLGLFGTSGCVPSNPSEGTPDAAAAKPARKPTAKPPPPPRATRTPPKTRKPKPGPVIDAPFEDNFDRPAIGTDWYKLGDAWSIKDGKLCGQGARNQGIWLRRRLPTNARIEFEATSGSSDGDIKAELWGDGASGATATSYTNATSYLTIFGGWKNSFHVLARIDEHAKDRLQVRVNPSSSVEREKPVMPDRAYAFRIERSDGKTISWWVDGHLIHRLEDPSPLVGSGHEHFGFNNWEVPVCFDKVKITPL